MDTRKEHSQEFRAYHKPQEPKLTRQQRRKKMRDKKKNVNKSNIDMSKNLEVEYQYEMYLKRMQLKESMMGPQQKIETKRAFYGGFSQALALMCDDVSDIDDEARAVLTIDDLIIQCEQFWKSENS